MRVIAELPHPDCKITIFSMNQKFIIKIEKGSFEQSYKLSELDIIEGVDGVFKILDNEFISTVVARFSKMRDDFNSAYNRYESK
ncbi:MAG: hypothetical protein WBP45_13840 [Daejeonella sp.]